MDRENAETKMMWLGMVLVLIVLTVFGVAMMGSVLGSKPKEVPVALVILDQPAERRLEERLR